MVAAQVIAWVFLSEDNLEKQRMFYEAVVEGNWKKYLKRKDR